jgi:hypothetical protein
MKATVIYQNGKGLEPEIFKFTVDKDCEKENIWETLENIWAKLNSDQGRTLRSMAVGDLIKLEYNGLMNFQTELYLCCNEGFIQI